MLVAPLGLRYHATRDCPSIRGSAVRELEESEARQWTGAVKRCDRPACRRAFARGSA